jgi:microsomal dipeptidase-like Zn-dependent dipeptidase
MNRVGMLVDLSHVSPDTMKAALETTQAQEAPSHATIKMDAGGNNVAKDGAVGM